MTIPLSRLRFTSLLLSLLLALAAANVATAEPGANSSDKKTSAEPSGMTLRMEVRRIPIDIVVTDKQGNPVKGLRRQDFTVTEDRKEQHVLSFEYVDSAQTFTPPKLPPLPTNTFVDLPSQPERGPLYILYYDMVNTQPDQQMSFHKQLFDFIDKAQPGTRIAIFINDSRLHMLQGFTSDHALLKAALLAKGPGPHMPDVFEDGRIYGQSNAGGALASIHFIAETMSGIPGRKNLLWLSTSFPIPVGPIVSGVNAQQGGVGGGFSSSTMQINDLSYLLQKSIRETYAALMRSQIALYPIDVCGIECDSPVKNEYEDRIAETSGGHAYYGNNRIPELIDKAIIHGEDYYSLSYEPSNLKFDGLQRNIQITLPKKYNYTLTYRTLYFAVSDEEVQAEHKPGTIEARALAKKSEDTLYGNMQQGAPMIHDLVFSAHLAPAGNPALATPDQMLSLEDSPAFFRTRKHDKPLTPLKPVQLQKYTIDYGVIDAQIKEAARRRGSPATLEFAAAAYDVDGKLLNSMLNDGQVSSQSNSQIKSQSDAQPNGQAQPAAKSDAIFHAIQELEVPPGAAFIRLAVRDMLNNRTGTIEVRLPLKPETTSASASASSPNPGQ